MSWVLFYDAQAILTTFMVPYEFFQKVIYISCDPQKKENSTGLESTVNHVFQTHPVMISNGGSSMGSGFSALSPFAVAPLSATASPFSAGTLAPFTSAFSPSLGVFSSFLASFSAFSFLLMVKRELTPPLLLLFLSAISGAEHTHTHLSIYNSTGVCVCVCVQLSVCSIKRPPGHRDDR